MRKTYVVNTNHDGIIGINSSELKAIKRAKAYIANSPGDDKPKIKRFDNGGIYMVTGNQCECRIEVFYMNEQLY